MKSSRLVLSILIILSIIIGCNNKDTKQKKSKEDEKKNYASNELKGMNLKGNVRSLRKVTYKAINKFGDVKKGKKELSGSFHFDAYKSFNKNGNMTIVKKYESDSTLVIENKCKFDKKGRKTTCYSFRSDKLPYTDVKTNKKTVIKYNNNNKIEENHYEKNKLTKKVKFQYNANGKRLKKTIYGSNGNLNEKVVFEYDSLDRVKLKRTYKSNKGGQLVSKTSFNYLVNKHQEDEYNYNSDGEVIMKMHQVFNNRDDIIEIRSNSAILGSGDKTTYDYNNSGLEVGKKVYGSKGKLKKEKTYNYEFDDQENWIKKVILKNKIPKYITVRKINYY